MKKILILVIGIVFLSCNQNESQKANENLDKSIEKSENFNWLLGKWKRLNEAEGKETFENWEKLSLDEYAGIGFTMQNGDTIKQEKMRIVKKNGVWDLEVKVPEETESIIFKMTKYSEDEFVCENTEIDFPNTIRYWRNGDKISASVSNPEMEIPFEFERILE